MAATCQARCRNVCNPRKLPVRRRQVRDYRPAVKPAQLPLFAVPQAAWRGLSQPRSRADSRLPMARGREFGQILRRPKRVSARVLQRNAARRSSIGRDRTGSWPTEFPGTQSEYGIPLAILDDPPRPARLPRASLAARRPGSRLPTTCRNTRNIRRRPRTAAGPGTAAGRRGCGGGRVRRSGAAAETPCRGSADRRDRRRI